MAKTKAPAKIPASFINGLKERIPINEFYTKLTGIQFVKDNSRLRAKVQWRRDEHPSLTYFSRSNTLTDFGDQSNYSGKSGKVYNHLDLLQVTKTCKSFYDSVLHLASYVGEIIPNDMLKAIQHYTKHQEALNEIYTACRKTVDSMFLDGANQNTSATLRAYCKLRCIPFDQKFFDLTELGVWPAESIIQAILKKYDIDTNKGNNDNIGFARFPDVENRGIVFPLYNKHGAMVGITLRTLEEPKKIYHSNLSDQAIAMYGLNTAISHKNVVIVEGEMNRVQVAARLWNEDHELAAKAIQSIFCTGSVSTNNKLVSFSEFFDRVVYVPDVQLKNIELPESRETIDNVIDVYNYLKPHNFKTIYWLNQKDKYDLDDYLRENVEDGKNAFLKLFKTHDYRKSMPEFVQLTIETLVTSYPEADRNSARYSFCERFARRLWNSADQVALRFLYSELTGVDEETVRQLDDAVFTQIGASNYYIKNNCYYVEEIDKGSGLPEKIEISRFIIRSKHKMIYMRGRNKPKSEEFDMCWESAEIYADISFTGRPERKTIIFQIETFVDSKKFWLNVFNAESNLIGAINKGREEDVFFCIKNTLITSIEKFSFSSPGPHIKSFAVEVLSDTLRPNLFMKGGTLKTFLNKYVSVIDGTVCENKYKNIDLSKTNYYKFGTCSEEELLKISQVLWYKLRTLHDTLLMDGLIGYAFCAPIKHILDPNINGLHLFLLGKSNSHKTSIARIVQNFYGDFATDDKVNSFSSSTPKYLEATVQVAGAAVCVCDELKISKEYTIEALNHFFHNIYNGKGRGRLNSNSERMDVNLFNANVITTAEYTQDLETSAEARYLRFNVPEINTESVYKNINGQETLPLFKCFTPYLIAWQHNHIEQIQERYEFYRKSIEKVIMDEPNHGRIALQLGLILVGFFSFCKFIEYKGICSTEEADKNIQNLFINIQQQAKVQVSRSANVRVFEKFKGYIWDALMTNRINMATMLYDGQDKPKDVRYSQPHNPSAVIFKYRKNPLDPTSIVYAMPSFKLLILEIRRNFDYNIADSLKQEFAEHGLARLDEKGNIQSVRIPNFTPGHLTEMKSCRAIIIPEAMINMEETNNDREPDGF